MKKYLLFLFLSIPLYAIAENTKLWDDEYITNVLKSEEVVDLLPMKEHLAKLKKVSEFSGDVYLTILQNGMQAVFKSQPIDDQADELAEVAAYKASLYLGFPNIPPTVMRKIGDKQGALQYYVETNIDSLDKEQYELAIKSVSKDEIAKTKMFYFVFGQWDSGPHNSLLLKTDIRTHFIAIDNAGIKNMQYVKSYGKLPFVRVLYSEKLNTNDWSKDFPFDKYRIINSPSNTILKKEFGEKLPESFYKNFNYHNKPLKYVLYNNSLWRQFHAFDNFFEKSYTTICPNDAIKKLDSLSINVLDEIFEGSKKSDFYNKRYKQLILSRRDMLLEVCKFKSP